MPPSEPIQERNEGGFLVVEPLAPLDSKLAPRLLQTVNLHLRRGITRLALDLGQAAFLTSVGLSVLIQLHKSFSLKGGLLVLFGLTPEAQEAVEASRLDDLLVLTRDAREAVERLGELEAEA